MLIARNTSAALPLTSLLLDSSVTGSLMTLKATHFFHNDSTDPLECFLKIPINEDSAVVSLEVTTDDGRVLKAKVEDKESALETYSDAISSGHSAFIGNMIAEREFQLSVGSLLPGTGVSTQITLVMPLKCIENRWLISIPNWLLQGWNGGSEPVTVAVYADLQREQKSGVFGFSLKINQRAPITAISSPSHSIDFSLEDNRLSADVRLTGKIDTKELKIEFKTTEDFQPKVQTQFDKETGEYVGMLSFIPALLADGQTASDINAPGEYILIIDRSGSMWNSRIEMANEASTILLKSLPQCCKFNVVSFGTLNVKMFPESRMCDSESISHAVREIATFTADMGGNDVLSTIRNIYRVQADPAYPRALFLLTDGGEPNHAEIVKYVEENSKSTRVHSFGIATTRHSMDGWLITEIARAARGHSVFIDNSNEISKGVIGVLKKAMSPALAGISVEWPSAEYEQFPKNSMLQDCFLGESFSVMVKFGRQPGAGTARLRAVKTETKEEVALEVPIDTAVEPGDTLHKLWAKCAIRNLDLEYRQQQKEETLRRIKGLSKTYGVPSEHTSFVCVDVRADPAQGHMKIVEINTGTHIRDSSPRVFMGMGGPPMGGLPRSMMTAPGAALKGMFAPCGPPKFGAPMGGPPPPMMAAPGAASMGMFATCGPPQFGAPMGGPPPSMMAAPGAAQMGIFASGGPPKFGPPMGRPPPSMMAASDAMDPAPMGVFASGLMDTAPLPMCKPPKFGAPSGGLPKFGPPMEMYEPASLMMHETAMPHSMQAGYPSPPAFSSFPSQPMMPPRASSKPDLAMTVPQKFGAGPAPGCVSAGISGPQTSSVSSRQSVPDLQSAPMLDIITKQEVSGFWLLADFPELLSVCPMPEFFASMGEPGKDLWTTLCVLIVLQTKFASRAEECEFIVNKALKVLHKAGVTLSFYEPQIKSALRL